jgi:hypothetical protein
MLISVIEVGGVSITGLVYILGQLLDIGQVYIPQKTKEG